MSTHCVDCGRDAELTMKTEDGEEYILCPSCLDKRLPNLRLGSLYSHLIRSRKPATKCPHCGYTRQKIEETELVGCPLCYEVFQEVLHDHFGVVGQ